MIFPIGTAYADDSSEDDDEEEVEVEEDVPNDAAFFGPIAAPNRLAFRLGVCGRGLLVGWEGVAYAELMRSLRGACPDAQYLKCMYTVHHISILRVSYMYLISIYMILYLSIS